MSDSSREQPNAERGRVRLRPEAVDWREVEGEVVALDRRESSYLAINRTGAALWPSLVGGATVDDLVSVLVARFDVDADRARGDVDAFLGDLDRRDLIETAPVTDQPSR